MTEMGVYNPYSVEMPIVRKSGESCLAASGTDRVIAWDLCLGTKHSVQLISSVDFPLYLTFIRPFLHIAPDISLDDDCHLIILSSSGEKIRSRNFISTSSVCC